MTNVPHGTVSYWTSAVGWLLLGLTGGLMDSIFWFVKNHGDPGCYQFPFFSMIGCVSSGFAWEIAFVLAPISATLIAIGARLGRP